MAFGIEELEELVVELGPEQVPQHGLRVVGAALGQGPGVVQHLRDRQERGVEVLDEAPAEHRIAQRGDDDQDAEQDAAVPERETSADRQRPQPTHHSSALSM